VDYPFSSNLKKKRLCITHFLSTEVVDYPPFVGVIVHGVHHVTSMEKILTILWNLE